MSEGWLKFPRVVVFYIPLYGMSAIPMFVADSGNPARAFGWIVWFWIILTVISAAAGVVVATVNRFTDKNSKFFETFNLTFIIAWVIIFCGILMLAKN